MRVVLDTNILISALGWAGGNEYDIVQRCFKKELTPVFSLETLEEFRKVAQRPKFEFSEEKISEFVSALLEIGEVVKPDETANAIAEDPKDNKFLDAAVAGKAQYIVSGDRHLLNLKKFKGVKIVKPADFLGHL